MPLLGFIARQGLNEFGFLFFAIGNNVFAFLGSRELGTLHLEFEFIQKLLDFSASELRCFLAAWARHMGYSDMNGRCHTPSWLNPGVPSHMCIHLTMDHDSTQLNAPPHMGNAEYSPTRTSLTLMDISGQAGMVH